MKTLLQCMGIQRIPSSKRQRTVRKRRAQLRVARSDAAHDDARGHSDAVGTGAIGHGRRGAKGRPGRVPVLVEYQAETMATVKTL